MTHEEEMEREYISAETGYYQKPVSLKRKIVEGIVFWVGLTIAVGLFLYMNR